MRLAALVSGGKDSASALYRALQEGHQIINLVSLIPKRKDSWMFHYPNINLTGLFAKAARIQLVKHETSGTKEEEVEDLRNALARLDVEGVVSGAIASQYQKSRIEEVCRDLGLDSVMPLWQQDPLKLLKELVQLKFEVIIVGVYAYGFSRDWLGRRIDMDNIKALTELKRRYHISLVGEGGEYETLVLDSPYFREKIHLVETEILWEKQSGYLLVNKAILTEKD